MASSKQRPPIERTVEDLDSAPCFSLLLKTDHPDSSSSRLLFSDLPCRFLTQSKMPPDYLMPCKSCTFLESLECGRNWLVNRLS